MATTDRYRRPVDLPRQIPLFPLRGAILLPRATLPLNVFEPRYLAMVDDVMRGDRLIGVIQPEQPAEAAVESPPSKAVPLKTVGGAGRVTTYQELDDGRILITLTGVCRFALGEEVATGMPYRTAQVDWDRFAVDLSPGVGEEAVDRERLLQVLRSYLDANRLKADWRAILASSSEFLVNALSVMSPYGPEEKQALLEAGDLKARAEVLVALAEMELASHGGGSTLQ